MKTNEIIISEFVQDIISDIEDVIDVHGETAWLDNEVGDELNLEKYVGQIINMSVKEASEIFTEIICLEEDIEIDPFLEIILEELGDWEHFEELLENVEGLSVWL